MLWAGSDDGLVHLSRDGGKTWQNVTPPDLPEWALISIIEPSPHDAGDRLPRGDALQARRLRALPLQDERLRQDLDEDHRRHPGRRLHARHPRGPGAARPALRRHRDGRLRLVRRRRQLAARCSGNLPVVPIHDLVVKDDDLVVATHGRSFWILDDLSVAAAGAAQAATGVGSSSPRRRGGAPCSASALAGDGPQLHLRRRPDPGLPGDKTPDGEIKRPGWMPATTRRMA